MKKTPITLEDRRQIQLEMLDEIDEFCRVHNLRYSLAFGTLLGAIRHKGYIPWDDDVDIIMPLHDMLQFKKEFKSKKLKYCDIDTEPDYEYSFSRICYLPTYSKKGLIVESYGISIDLYPVVGLPKTVDEINAFFLQVEEKKKKRKKMIIWKNRIIRRFPLKTIPGFHNYMRKFTKMVNYSYPYDNSNYKLHAGRIVWDNVFDFDVFSNMIEVDFEGHKYMAPAEYHKYLSHCYGDYMKLPPEEQRHPYHGGTYYWK